MDYEAAKYTELVNTHSAIRPLQQLTPLGIAEWGWQNGLITFVEMVAIIEWPKEAGKLEPVE
jgi:hypothetical protein